MCLPSFIYYRIEIYGMSQTKSLRMRRISLTFSAVTAKIITLISSNIAHLRNRLAHGKLTLIKENSTFPYLKINYLLYLLAFRGGKMLENRLRNLQYYTKGVEKAPSCHGRHGNIPHAAPPLAHLSTCPLLLHRIPFY